MAFYTVADALVVPVLCGVAMQVVPAMLRVVMPCAVRCCDHGVVVIFTDLIKYEAAARSVEPR